MVRLSEYVSEVLIELLEGVAAAQAHAKKQGKSAEINPIPGLPSAADVKHHTQTVEFDIALTATESEGGKVGLGVFGGAFGFGGNVEAGQGQEQAHRVRFTVPVFLPLQ